MRWGPAPDRRDEGAAFTRGCLVGLAITFALIGLVVALLLLARRGPDPSSPGPGPTTTSTIVEPSQDAAEAIIAAEWTARRFGCGTPTTVVVDAIAPVLIEQRVPSLDARIAVGRWRDRVACPGR